MSDLKSRTTAPKVPAPLDLTRPSLQALSYLLRHPDEWPASFQKWSYVFCQHCAMGLAAAQWPEQDAEVCARFYAHRTYPPTAIEATLALLDIPLELGAAIFVKLAGPNHIRRMEDVTPLMVADAIDAYLETR